MEEHQEAGTSGGGREAGLESVTRTRRELARMELEAQAGK
jgi:hypothetical protein